MYLQLQEIVTLDCLAQTNSDRKMIKIALSELACHLSNTSV